MTEFPEHDPVNTPRSFKWASFVAAIVLLSIGFLAFPSPPPPSGMGIFVMGVLLLFDWSWEDSIGFAIWRDLESRTDEVASDFYDFDHAKWRYLLAAGISVIIAAAFSLTQSFEVQATALIGGIALFGMVGFVGVLRSRQRVKTSPRP